MIQYKTKLWASICVLAWLSACGGGGENDGPIVFTPPIPLATPTSSPVISCEKDGKFSGPVEVYLTQPHARIDCKQFVVINGNNYFPDFQRYIAGFSDSQELLLSELSQYSRPPDQTALQRLIFSPPRVWRDVGDTDIKGELWWGRLVSEGGFSIHVAAGQLSWERQATQLRLAGDLLAAIRMSSGQASPFLSPLPRRYELLGGTAPTFEPGLGRAPGFPPLTSYFPGSIANATLVVNPSTPISGSLDMSIDVDGHTVKRMIPLRSMVGTDTSQIINRSKDANFVWSLIAAPSIGSQADCTDRRGRQTSECYFPPELETDEKFYLANVQFFGAHSEYAVASYRLEVDSPPEKNTSNNIGTGLIVLKLAN